MVAQKIWGPLALASIAGAGWLLWQLNRPGARPARRTDPILSDLLLQQAGRIDYADAWAAPIADGETDDPLAWTRALGAAAFNLPAVAALMRVRNAVVRLVGLAAVADHDLPASRFPVLAEGDHELVTGLTDQHLNFCLGVDTHDQRVTLTTTVTLNNRFGAAYWWGAVRWFHPAIVAALLRHAHVTAADEAQESAGAGN
ncbi:MAG: DUF2867 domain-containing protein [Propionibacteriaceae bacterium]|jgi:hypothetical protein|nr:DUF2867 domain-containing protein [Propionibacteriaceae bacterium]